MELVGRVLLVSTVVSMALSAQTVGSGTSVVILRSPKVLMAAVDSKETFREYRDGRFGVAERNMCKVAVVGPYYAIVAGVAHGSNGFDALRAAAEGWRPGDRLSDLAMRARNSIPALLRPLLESLRENDPEDFRLRDENQAALQLTFLGAENGLPSVAVIEFVSRTGSDGNAALTSRVTACPGDCSGVTTGYFLGTHDRIDEFLKLDRDFIAHPDERHLEQLIGLEYSDRPDVVGGPVSMLRVGKAGAAVVRSGACAP